MDGLFPRDVGGLREQVARELAPLVEQIDREGLYPGDVLRRLGAAGAFASHLSAHAPGHREDLGRSVEAMGIIAETCMSAGFCTWCQDTLGWYLENTSNIALRERLQPAVAFGAALGGTGLSNPLKSLAGIETFKLRAARVPGGYTVSGTLPWVSNLGDGHWFGTVFQDAADPDHRIMAMVQCGQPGVELRQNAHFIALEGTGTYSVLFRRAFISDDQMLADPLGDMVGRVRPGFVMLQMGMGLGVTEACITLMREADVQLGHTNRFLPRGADAFADDLGQLRADIARLAASPRDTSTRFLLEVLRARLRVSELTLAAGQSALLHAGARGYIEHSPVNRRIREGYFVALITPSIKHLHQEIARLETLH